MGVGDVKALAERAGSSQRAKMLELEALLAKSDQLEKEVEGGSYYGSRTIDQISAGWDAFYRVEDRIEQNELIIREYSQLFLEISSFSSRQEQMREISQPTQIQERGAGVARCESQLVKPLLETGSESTALQQTKPQPQPQQQQLSSSSNNSKRPHYLTLGVKALHSSSSDSRQRKLGWFWWLMQAKRSWSLRRGRRHGSKIWL